MKWVVEKSDVPIKLSLFIKNKLSISGKKARQLIVEGKCSLNEKIERFANATLVPQDVVEITSSDEPIQTPHYTPDRILFQDAWFLAYDKSAHISSDDASFLKEIQNDFPHLALVHRLDKGTTGVLLFAKTQEAKKEIEALFRKRLIHKEYLALADGVMKKKKGEITNKLGELHREEGKVIWGKREHGVYASTRYEVVKAFSNSTLVKCLPETGRTHQIRIHLADLGHPLLGDFQYGKSFLCPQRPLRVMLHAHRLSFTHPNTHKEVMIVSPLPGDFSHLLHELDM